MVGLILAGFIPRPVASESNLSDDLIFVARGIDNCIESLGQAKGTSRLRKWTDKGTSPEQDIEWHFAIDGKRARMDKYAPGKDGASPVPLSKEAFDGERTYGHSYRDGKEGNNIVIGSAEHFPTLRTYSWAGQNFDPRKFYLNEDFTGNRTFLKFIQDEAAKGINVEVQGDVRTDPEVVVVLHFNNLLGLKRYRREFHVNIDDGFTIPLYEYTINEKTLVKEVREYRKDAESGVSALAHCEQTYYKDDGSGEVFHALLDIDYESVNKPVPAETFTLEGFGLSPGIKVTDYTKDSTTASDVDLDDLDMSILDEPSSDVVEMQPSDSVKNASQPVAANQERSKNPAENRPNRVPLYAVLIGIAAVVITAALLRKKRK